MQDERFPELMNFAGYKSARDTLAKAEQGKADADGALAALLLGVRPRPDIRARAAAWLAGKTLPAPTSTVTDEEIEDAQELVATMAEAVEQAAQACREQRAAAATDWLSQRKATYRQHAQAMADALQGVADACVAEQLDFAEITRLAGDVGVRNTIQQRALNGQLVARIRAEAAALRTGSVLAVSAPGPQGGGAPAGVV